MTIYANIKQFEYAMYLAKIPIKIRVAKYLLLEIPHINRFVTFKDDECMIGRKLYDGHVKWEKLPVEKIGKEIRWLWSWWINVGRPYEYDDKPWELKLMPRKVKRLPGTTSKKKSVVPRLVWKKYWEQIEKEKMMAKEKKRREAFERDVARMTRKTNR